MKTLSVLAALALIMSLSGATYGLSLFTDLNMDGNDVTNAGDVVASAVETDDLTAGDLATDGITLGGTSMTNWGSSDIRYPDGYGTPEMKKVNNSTSYTVPSDKTFYVVSVQMDSSGYLQLDDENYWYFWYTTAQYSKYGANQWGAYNQSFASPMIVAGGTKLDSNSPWMYVYGFEVDEGVTVVNEQINNSTTYTVPTGKELYLTTLRHDDGSGYMYVDDEMAWRFYDMGNDCAMGMDDRQCKCFATPLMIDEGSVLKSNGSWMYITGYLKDK